jgi:hypothetical protein
MHYSNYLGEQGNQCILALATGVYSRTIGTAFLSPYPLLEMFESRAKGLLKR